MLLHWYNSFSKSLLCCWGTKNIEISVCLCSFILGAIKTDMCNQRVELNFKVLGHVKF
jgi:hypothetical protein